MLFRKGWIKPQRIEVTVGLHDLFGNEPFQRSIKASSYMGGANENAYDPNSANNDFIVIKLSEVVAYTPHTRPVCLPDPKQPLPFNKTCYTSGWGSIDVNGTIMPTKLMQVEAQILPYEMCDREVNNKTMLCAGLLGERKSACFGDSGGPLACEMNNVWVLYGIVSWGRECASPTSPVVYTHVSYFIDRIREIGEHWRTHSVA
ncbi:hypothetical protein M514_01596 [Trichuris suis]|uniref:Peptidase S1 domain-containing protein n=1 Tax=Trichuris suis TaxID=68888 RepID=A0A085MJU7_9BILA|nr:hypothetical protein M513_01596 [Trichuris suis]KFD66599.1 hypothetical protein M514_01596 [Trichuris suis]KHJ49147.1 trypsin [Trichuris suis]